MRSISLNGRWNVAFADGRAAQVDVPGCFDSVAGRWDVADVVSYTTTFTLDGGEKYARLRFGGVSYYCDVYVNDALVGSHEGMWDGFDIDISGCARPGENRLRIDVTKPGYHAQDRFPLRQVLSGFVPDVLCTFGGLWDDVALERADAFFVDAHSAAGDMRGKVCLDCDVDARVAGSMTARLTIADAQGVPVASATQTCAVQPGRSQLNIRADIESPRLWSPEDPYLYSYRLELELAGQREQLEGELGCRDVRAEGTHIMINDAPCYLRGILHWGYYDDAIIPNPSPETIDAEINAIREYGFNAIKHCLYIPREEYFRAADRAGVLLWIELPLWLPEPSPELENRIRREYPRLLRQIAGHPSVCAVSLGCELDDSVGGGLLREMYELAQRTSRALVRDNSGSGECYGGLQVDYADFFDYHFYAELQNMENLIETFTPGWRNTRPWLFGEFCDSDTMRDLAQIRRAKGVDKLNWELADHARNPISLLKPDFFLGEHDARMEQSGIRADFELIRALSYDHALTHRKVTLEQTRACPVTSGYNITSIRDVPIATSGMFDDLMRPKFDAARVRASNADAVLCPAWDLGRMWINADRVKSRERYNFASGSEYTLRVLLSNYAHDAQAGTLTWRLMRGAEQLCGGSFDGIDCARGDVIQAGRIVCTLPEVTQPCTLRLEAEFNADGVHTANDWPVFVYPAHTAPAGRFALYDPTNEFFTLERVLDCTRLGEGQPVPEGTDVVITTLITPAVRAYVEAGGRALLMQQEDGVLPVRRVAFWREGVLRQYDHEIVRPLKREMYCDELRYFSMTATSAIETDKLAERGFGDARPILRRYDCREWYASDYMLECTLGSGRMVATTLRLQGGMGKQAPFIANNPGAVYLLTRAVEYLARG